MGKASGGGGVLGDGSPEMNRVIISSGNRQSLGIALIRLEKEVEPWCQNCLREDGIRVNGTTLHELYECPTVNQIIRKIANNSISQTMKTN